MLSNTLEHFKNNVQREDVYTQTFSNCVNQYRTVIKLKTISNFD